jgi:hypothetical protein
MIKKLELQRRLEQEEYILAGIRPSSGNYQVQRQKVNDIKTQIEFLEKQEQNLPRKEPDNKR